MKLIEYPPLIPFRNRYQDLSVQPLRITAILRPNTPIVCYDPIHLDNFLARCVVDEATEGRGLPESDIAYDLPVPLQRLWTSDGTSENPRGLPLFASTCFTPDGPQTPDTIYWHKRAQSGRFTATAKGTPFRRETIKGRWMERRVPTPVTVCPRWTARCVGNAAEILRLLETVKFIGKRRSCGFGEVDHWKIEPLSLDLAGAAILIDHGRILRPVPSGAAALLPSPPAEPPQLIGWTPPQWKPSLFSEGWRFGTRLQQEAPSPETPALSREPDFFAAVDQL